MLVSRALLAAVTGQYSVIRSFSSPCVYDKIVRLTFTDKEGKRHQVSALEGQTVAEVVADNQDILGAGYLCLSPEGRGLLDCNIQLPNEYLKLLKEPTDEEQRSLDDIAASVTPNSRLGSKIWITKGLDSMNIALGPVRPWRSL